MAKHEFGIMRTAPRAHERYDLYEPDKYRCISVPDETVEPLLERLSAVECFWHTLQHPGKGLAYAGITLIPPASLAELLRCLDGAPGTEELKALISQAIQEEKYIIHFGI